MGSRRCSGPHTPHQPWERCSNAWCVLQIILEQEARIEGFKTELGKSQDVQLSTVNKDLERQQNFLDKMRAEVRQAPLLLRLPEPSNHIDIPTLQARNR